MVVSVETLKESKFFVKRKVERQEREENIP